jgi:hypothetical protein
LALFLVPCPLVQQFRQVLFLAPHALYNLNNNPPALQLDFLAFVEFPVALPVHVSDKIAALIVDHNPLVEGVISEATIFPSLLLPPEVVRKQAHEFEDRSAAAGAAGVH